MPIELEDWACVECGRVYNPVLRDLYWKDQTIAGEEYDLLCDDCKSDLEEQAAPSASAR